MPLATKREAPGCGGAGLTFAASDDTVGSWLRRHGKLAVTSTRVNISETVTFNLKTSPTFVYVEIDILRIYILK